MMDVILKTAAQGWVKESDEEADRPKVAILGKPNVGKSTLVNRLLGENRMIVSDIAGTTRDSVATPYSREGRAYYLIDTAGVRRKSRVSEKIEKISIVKTLQTLQRAQVIILVVDAKIGITEQDASLAGLVREHGRSMVLAVNKWDGLEPHHKDKVRRGLQTWIAFPRLGAGVVYFRETWVRRRPDHSLRLTERMIQPWRTSVPLNSTCCSGAL